MQIRDMLTGYTRVSADDRDLRPQLAALARIRLLLGAQKTIPFSACLPALLPEMHRERAARAAVASSFAAVLELTRQGEAVVQQDEALGDIHLRKSGEVGI